MLPRKNIFGYFAISVYIISLIYILAGGLGSLGAGQEYPHLQGGIFLILLLCGWLLLNGVSGLFARIDKERRLSRAAWIKYAEFAVVVAVLAAAAFLRIRVVRTMPMEVSSDYKTYYEVAELLAKDALLADGPGYCDYIALFPHVYGYPYVLSFVFRIFGASVLVAQYFNVFLSVATIFVAYKTARLAGGRLSGLTALVLVAFWPSQILYINMVASEYLFSFLLMVCIYLFIVSIKQDIMKIKHPVWGVMRLIFLGALLAFTAMIRPMALLLLITVVICICFEKQRLPVRETKDQPISLMILSKGWMRCFLVLAVYIAMNVLTTIGATNAVDRDLASGSASYGYNLLVGLNVESEGGWNDADAEYLYAALDRTGSATEAHLACLDLAVQRLGSPESLTNLFLRKFQVLWNNDDYGTTWNLLFMDQQGTLTPEREQLLYSIRGWGNIFYLLVVGLAAIEGVYLWQKGAGVAYPFILMYLGTVAMHLLVENQNRYHFHALFMLAILAALGVREICESSRVRVQQRLEERRYAAQCRQEDEMKRAALLEEEKNLTAIRRQAMQSKFDMKDALEKGYITVRVSKACADAAMKEDAKKERQDGENDQAH